MANNQPVPVHPATLKWIRIELGLSTQQVADKLKLSIEQLQNWESGSEGITLSQSKKIAKKYKVSLPFLYLKQTPKKHRFKSIIDFRSASYQENFSDRLCLAIKTIHERQVWMREFLQEEGQKPLEWLGRFSGSNNIDNIAKQCRQWLEIKQQEISDLKDDKEAFYYWIEKIEAKGVIVANNNNHRFSQIDRKEYSGLVLYDQYAPLILLNPKDSYARRIFTLLHELAHLLVKPESCLSLIDFRTDESEYDEVEVFCNNIASNILIDSSFIKNNWQHTLSFDDNVEKFINKFKVSYSAFAVAIKKINIINQTKLNELLDFYKQQYKQQPKGGRTVPDKQVLDRCGKLLTTQVLTAYEQGSINASEVHGVLGMKLKYLGDLSERLQFPLHRWIV